MLLCDLNQIPASVVENSSRSRPYGDGWLRKMNAGRPGSFELCLDIVDTERSERSAVLDQGFLERELEATREWGRLGG